MGTNRRAIQIKSRFYPKMNQLKVKQVFKKRRRRPLQQLSEIN